MISEQDIQTAKRISRRWGPNERFSSEDAYQEILLGLLESKSTPDRPRLRTRIMHQTASKFPAEYAYMMRVPYTSYRKMGGPPTHVKYTGLSTDVVGPEGVPEYNLEQQEDGYQKVENKVALSQLLATLSEPERARVLKWAENPGKMGGTQSEAVKTTLAKMRRMASKGLKED